MHIHWRNFPLMFALATAVGTPAFGQPVAPSVGPAIGGSESPESIPDLSGVWAHALGGCPLAAAVTIRRPPESASAALPGLSPNR
jgi:hypothetical protein